MLQVMASGNVKDVFKMINQPLKIVWVDLVCVRAPFYSKMKTLYLDVRIATLWMCNTVFKMLRKLDLDANSLLISSISKRYFVFLMRLFFFPHSIARYVDWVVALWRGQQTAGIFNTPEDNTLSCLWSTTYLSLRCGVSLLPSDSFLFVKVWTTNWPISKHP